MSQPQRFNQPTLPRVPAALPTLSVREPKGKGYLIMKLNKFSKRAESPNTKRAKSTPRTVIRSLLNGFGRAFSWQHGVKSVRAGMGPFISMGSILAGKASPTLALGVYSLLKSVIGLYRAQGARGAALYLKASSVYLMRYVGENALKDESALGPIIGLTRSGIPRIIPPVWRRAISSQSVWVIRLTLTIFGLYRVFDFKGKVSVKTITNP